MLNIICLISNNQYERCGFHDVIVGYSLEVNKDIQMYPKSTISQQNFIKKKKVVGQTCWKSKKSQDWSLKRSCSNLSNEEYMAGWLNET